MKNMTRNEETRRVRAFTLIEMLAVIGIIGVLAALLFPAIKLALQKAEIAQAQNDIKNIETAVKSFYTEYGKWPNGNGGTADFSYGAFSAPYAAHPPTSASGPSSSGYCENYWLMNVLQAIQDIGTVCGNGGTPTFTTIPPVNSRGIVFLNIPAKSLKVVDTIHGYADFVDPWKNPYQITVDANFDNVCTNLAMADILNGSATTPLGVGNTSGWVTNTVVVWSFGPLGPYGTHTSAKDWITSW
jgi:prepilin-type N-terminal cleavage/methylation domain-containing protein